MEKFKREEKLEKVRTRSQEERRLLRLEISAGDENDSFREISQRQRPLRKVNCCKISGREIPITFRS